MTVRALLAFSTLLALLGLNVPLVQAPMDQKRHLAIDSEVAKGGKLIYKCKVRCRLFAAAAGF